jgi:predicted ATPase
VHRISIRNFKGIQEAAIDFTKLNVFVGENGTGKSTVIHALSLLKRSLNTYQVNTDLPYVNMGPLNNVVPAGETAAIMLEGGQTLELAHLHSDQVKFRLEVQFDVQGLLHAETQILEPYKIKSSWERYGFATVDPGQLQLEDLTFNLAPGVGLGQAFQPMGYVISKTPKTDPLSAQRSGQVILPELMTLSTVAIRTVTSTYVVPLFRGFSEPSYQLQPAVSLDLNPRAGLIAMGNAVASNLAYLKSSGEEKIHRWMQEVMGVAIDWRPVPGGQVAIQNPDKSTFFVNEGFGSNQLTFILEEVVRTEDGSLISVEEPEIHLHPDAQFKFGKLMATISLKEKKQILLVTHSEHIVSAVLTGLREKKITPEEVSIWYFEKKNDKISVTRAEVDNEGHTKGGLTTFIEASIKELKDYSGSINR